MGKRRKPVGYHQMLVSPRLGGAEKIALALHRYIATERAGSGRLIVPRGGYTETLAREQEPAPIRYDLERLFKPGRVDSWSVNLGMSLRMAGYSQGLIHIHSPFVYGAFRPFLAASRLKTILHLHLDYTEEELRWPLTRPPDAIVTCAEYLKPAIERALPAVWARPEIKVVANAVDTRLFFPADRLEAKSALGIDAATPLLLMVANIARHKGQETAIRAHALLCSQGYRPRLWIVGEERHPGEGYAADLRNLGAALRVADSVEFLGFRADVPALLRAADFLLLPSVAEGLPLVVLEAQASKTVVLAAPTAGIPEVVEDGRTGFLIPAADAEAYARRIAALWRDRDRAAQVADAAYHQVVDRLGFPRYCGRMAEVYADVLGAA